MSKTLVAVTNYLSIDSQAYGHSVAGDPSKTTYYTLDALGSVVATTDNKGNILNTYEYKPFSGEVLQKTGSAPDPRFMWNGSHGYRTTNLPQQQFLTHYVRARHYQGMTAAWTTQDPLWPQEPAYRYVENMVTKSVDYWGTRPCMRTKKGKSYVKVFCFDRGGRHIEPPVFSDSSDLTNEDNFCNGCRYVCSATITLSVNYHVRSYAGAGPSVDVYEKRVESGCPKMNPAIGAIATTILGFIPVYGKWITGAISIIGSAGGLIGKPKPDPTIPPGAEKCNPKYGFTLQLSSKSFVDIYDCREPDPTDPCVLYPPSSYSEPGAIIPKPGGGVIRQ
ncbi:hypothetical protein QM565_30460 [Geitlerinema splendidum]|nr:hypothetical protein [Geitlerinema splendidum]